MNWTRFLTMAALMAASEFAVAEEEGQYIEEVIVTATYRETSLMDTPLSVSAADADVIEQLGATSLDGLFRTLPGLNVAGGLTGSNRMVVRGISSQTGTQSFQQTFSTVATYIDDTPMTSANGPAQQLGGSLFDIERVEVLKGPQGTLFGEGSQGGTIRYIYNEPDPERVDYKIKAGFNTQNESDDTGYRVDGMINLPLADNFAVRVSAFSEEKAGWMDKVNLTPIEEDINTLESTGGRLSAKWWPTDRLSIRGSVFYVDTETEGSPFGQVPHDELENVRIPGLAAMSEDEFTLYNLRFDYNFDFATFTSTTSYFERDTHSLIESPASLAFLFDAYGGFLVNLQSFQSGGAPTIPCNPGMQDPSLSNFFACPYGDGLNLTAFNNDSTSESKRFVQEFRLVSSGDGPWQWTAGAFYKTSEDFRLDFQPYIMGPGREALAPFYAPIFSDPANNHTDELEEISVFGEVTYQVNDQFDITVGARFSDLEQEFENTATTTDDQPISPKLTLSWHPGDNQLYYFTYGTGFRPGNVNNGMELNARQFTAAGFPQADIDLANSRVTFEGDEVTNYELGTKLTLADGRLSVTASAYYLDWEDTIVLVTDATIPSANNTFNQNVGSAHSQGVELELTWFPIDRLSFSLGADFNEAETDDDNLASGVPEGNSLIYAPEHSLAASVDWSFDIGSLEGRLRLDHQLVDEQFADISNTTRIDEYDLTNLRFTLTDPSDGRWSAAIFANNVTNEESAINAFPRFGTEAFVYLQPRVVGLELTWQAQ